MFSIFFQIYMAAVVSYFGVQIGLMGLFCYFPVGWV
jgi:hypothetical protein